MKQKRLYEEARIDVVQLSSKSQLLAESDQQTPNLGAARYNNVGVGGITGGFEE